MASHSQDSKNNHSDSVRFIEVFGIIWDGKKIWAFSFLFSWFVAFVVILMGSKSSIQGTVVIAPESSNPLPQSLQALGSLGVKSIATERYMILLDSTRLRLSLLEELKSKVTTEQLHQHLGVSTLEDLIYKIDRSMTIQPDKGDSIAIKIKTSDRDFAVEFMKAALLSTRNFLVKYETEKLNDQAKLLETQISESKLRISTLENELVMVRRKSNSFSSLPFDQARATAFVDLTSQLEKSKAELEATQSLQNDSIKSYESEIARVPAANTPEYVRSSDYSKAKFLEENIHKLKYQSEALKKSLDAFASKSGNLVFDQQRLFFLNEELKREGSILDELTRNLLFVQFSKSGIDSRFTVLDEPTSRDVSNFPSPLMAIFICTILGFLLGGFSIYAREMFSPIVRSPHDLADLNLDTLAVIPVISPALRERPFRTLRSILMFGFPGNGTRAQIIAITSPKAESGSSFVARRLAMALAFVGKKVLLVDADHVNQSLTNEGNLHHRHGFYEWITNQQTFEACVSHMKDKESVDTLFHMGLGQIKDKGNYELLLAKHLADKLKQVQLKFDYIILDTPPVTRSSETLVTVKLCDLILLTLKTHSTYTYDVENCLKLLRRTSSAPIKAILNGLNPFFSRWMADSIQDKKVSESESETDVAA